MTALYETILQISLSTAAVIGVLLLLVPLWQKRYSARWRKVIWLILAVRLLVPFSLELPQTVVQLEMDLQAAPVWQGGQVIADSNAAAHFPRRVVLYNLAGGRSGLPVVARCSVWPFSSQSLGSGPAFRG